MARIQIEFYGRLSDSLGKSLHWDLPDAELSIAQLRTHLAKSHDNETLLEPSIRAVINDEMVQNSAVIKEGDNVAFFSPLSGG